MAEPVSEQVDQKRADKAATITSWEELKGWGEEAKKRGFSPKELSVLKERKARLKPRGAK